MKKRLTAILLTLILLLTITGCSAANAAQKLDAAEDVVEEKLDALEDNLELSVQNTSAPAAPVQSAPTEAAPAPAKTAALTQEEAEKIALDYAGFTADQVQRMRTEYEIDDGIPQYDVEYHEGDWEYEFEINAEDGRILSYDKDHKYD